MTTFLYFFVLLLATTLTNSLVHAQTARVTNTVTTESAGVLFDRHPLLVSVTEWQNARRTDSLVWALKDTSALVRARVALALANVQDPTTATVLVRYLDDSDVTVRRLAAFALGQIGIAAGNMESSNNEPAELALWKQYHAETEVVVKQAILEALGKCGSQTTMIRITNGEEFRKSSLPKPLITGALMAVARLGLKNIMTPSANDFCFDWLRRPESEKNADIGFAASYLFSRAPVSQWKPYSQALGIVADMKKYAPEVQINIAKALAKTGNAQFFDPVRKMVKSQDWRVRVECARVFGAFGSTTATVVGLNSLTADKSMHVRLTVYEQLRLLNPRYDDKTLKVLKIQALAPGTDPRERGALIKTIALAEPNWAWNERERWAGDVTQSPHPILQIDVIEAIGQCRDTAAQRYLTEKVQTSVKMLTHSNTNTSATNATTAVPPMTEQNAPLGVFLRNNILVSAAALNALHASWRRSRTEVRFSSAATAVHYKLLEQALNTSDIALMNTAADALADSAFIPFGAGKALAAKLQTLKTPRDVEAIDAVIRAIAKIRATDAISALTALLQDSCEVTARAAADGLEKLLGSRPAYRVVKPPQRSISLDKLREAWNNNTVQITTALGDIVITLDVESAPLTVLNFLALMNKGKLNGVPFHRVVADFVVQGGDYERGDGWGGSESVIRSEFAPVPFERGVLGMASAGKDTEGSQYFIMHSAAPHLDGRYTAFGRVVRGMDIVDKLLPYDEAIEVKAADLSVMTKAAPKAGKGKR